jgi:hypothetical protein
MDFCHSCAHTGTLVTAVADVLKRWQELLKVMAAKDTQLLMMPQSDSSQPAAVTESQQD